MTRREFVRAENVRLGRFLDVADLVGWRREYRCGCGFRCTAPGDIWDHSQACDAESLPEPGPVVQPAR